MKKILIKSDIILMFLICAALTLIILFVDLTPNKESAYNIDVYKAYYVYDKNTEPISISYHMLNVNKSLNNKKIIEEIFDEISKNIDLELILLNISIVDDKVILTVNKDLKSDNKALEIECLVNSILEIDNYKTVEFKYKEETFSYEKNINKYYVNSPITNKLSTFLYKDDNYKLIYKALNDEKVYFNIKKASNKDKIIYTFHDEDMTMQVKKNSLYINDNKILVSDFKVNETWKSNNINYKVTGVKLNEDNTLTVCIVGTDDNYTYTYYLKQGLGISSYEKKDKSDVIETYSYFEREFMEA